MINQVASQFAQPRIDARALLGLYDPADATDWGPIRAAQIHAGRRLALLLLAVNVAAATLVILIGTHSAPRWALLGWGALVAAIAAWVTFRRLAPAFRGAATAPVAAVRDTLIEGLALGAVWTIPPLTLAFYVGLADALALLLTLVVLMTASAIAMAALPLATLAFLGMIGLAVATMLLLLSGPLLGTAALLFTALLMISCFSRAKALVVVRASELALAERDETVSLLLRDSEDKAADWLWEIDANRRIVRASPRFAYAVGLDPLTINQQPLLQILAGPNWQSGEFPTGLRELSDKLKQRTAFRDLTVNVRVKGEDRWWEIAATPRTDENGDFIGWRGVGSDVTEARASAEQIHRMARYDALTGLPNRLLIHETLARSMAEAEKWSMRCGFMMIDLDRFKAVNDSLGHPVGDRLLGRVAQRLAQLMGENEMVGRLGGDEFAVVIRDAHDTARTERLARAIIDAVSAPYELDQNTLHIGASIGIASFPRDGRTPETLIRSADLALYRSKDAGGGTLHFYEPQLHVQAEERRVLEMALRRALSNGELSLQFQPVVNATTSLLTGFEALLRWDHPELGSVPPSRFIPLAEETRLIGPIGDWALRHACEEAVQWRDPVSVAVNVSPQQLQNPAFVGTVAQALAISGLAPERLELEVTESVFIREGTGATQTLERLLGLGIKLSLDDFGTGYSSLGYLSRTRFSTIKVDRSFVLGAAEGMAEAVAIIRAVVALAESLNMATTAEGVETETEHRLMRDLGCTNAQGFYFGRPLEAADARQLATPRGADAATA